MYGGRDGERHHQEESAGGYSVAHGGRAFLQEAQRPGGGEPHEGALPEEVNQGPGDRLDGGGRPQRLGPSHFASPSSRSNSSRISASSSGFAGREERARRTSRLAEPSNARSRRSPTSCVWVCSSGNRTT